MGVGSADLIKSTWGTRGSAFSFSGAGPSPTHIKNRKKRPLNTITLVPCVQLEIQGFRLRILHLVIMDVIKIVIGFVDLCIKLQMLAKVSHGERSATAHAICK